jgi:hypothetical protein
VPLGIPKGAMCVQRLDDSLNSAIHINYRVSLRSSSMREPRYPLLRVVLCFVIISSTFYGSRRKISSIYQKGFKWLITVGRFRLSSMYARKHTEHSRVNGIPQILPTFIEFYFSQWFIRGYVIMILPQVHLRKPCYDFYFL